MMTTAQQPALNLMPLPASAQSGTGSLAVDASFSVTFTSYTEPRLERAGERFLRQLARQTGLLISLKPGKGTKSTLVVQTDHGGKDIQEVGEDESYVLEVATDGAKLTAPTPLGTMHGLQTFLQLVDVSPSGFTAPALKIQDQPRFPWRGLMIDSARHFIPLDVIRRNIDGMEAVKMNVFHWHLSENQGFRVESRKYPKLHELGSDSLYYTQDEIRDLIAYARDRGIRVCRNSICLVTAPRGSSAIPSWPAEKGRTESSAGGESSIRQWTRRTRRSTSFLMISSARWPSFSPTTISTSVATR